MGHTYPNDDERCGGRHDKTSTVGEVVAANTVWMAKNGWLTYWRNMLRMPTAIIL